MRLTLLCGLLACKTDPTPLPAPTEGLGLDPSVPAGPGETRAGVVREGVAGEAALFGGITAEGAAGDVKLHNSEVQFIIQGAYRSHGLVNVGGGILDADRVRTDGSLGRDTVEDLFLAFGIGRVFHADSVEVVADGTSGEAVVVARGSDVPWEYIQGVLESSGPLLPDLNLDITQTYRLGPDTTRLQVRTELTNTGAEPVTFTLADGLFLSGDDVLPWAPGAGFEGVEAGPTPAVVFTGRTGEATLASWPDEGTYSISSLASLTEELGISLAEFPSTTLASGETVTFGRTVDLARDTATTEADRLRSQGQVLGRVSGTVSDPEGPVAGARVHFVDAQENVAGIALSDAEGGYSADLVPGTWTAWVVAHDEPSQVELPEGAGRYGPYAATSVNQAQLDVLSGARSATALPWAMGRATPAGAPFEVSSTARSLDLHLEAPAGLEVQLSDGGSPLAGVIDVRWSGAAPDSPVPAGLRGKLGIPGGGRAASAWTVSGASQIPVLPGTYTVSANHSWRYGRDSTEVTVAAGGTATATLQLDEVVVHDGWLALDPHLHGAPSFDGSMPMEDRLLTCVATGVELPVSTDHDAVGDYRPLVDALGLHDRMEVIPGFEVTTVLRGHFNVYPIVPAPLERPNGGAEPWWLIPASTEDLFERMRTTGGDDALLQVNHPRAPGMFGLAGYDPSAGDPSDPSHFSWDFDTFELVNGVFDDIADIRADWFSFLNAGRIKVPVGASDSHYRFVPCGVGRTDIWLGGDTVDVVTPDDVRAALLAGHVVVASGTTLRASLEAGAQTALPGDTVTGDAVRLNATVRAPAWIEPGTLRVYRNGEVVVEQVLTEATEGVWFDGGWDLHTAEDAWYVVEVEGDASLGPAWRDATPYAATNAFFVDVAGDGWTAPGL